MVRKCVWFNPINPPVIAFKLANNAINVNDVFIKINDKIDSGASFCHVDKIIAGIQAIDVITDGYHKWHGAMPVFISKENSSTTFINVMIWCDIQSDILLKINKLDPRA